MADKEPLGTLLPPEERRAKLLAWLQEAHTLTIDAIAQRELTEAAHEGFDSARRENPFFVRTPAWRK